MPTVKIENKSGDDIIITLDGEEKELADGESVFFENKEKGGHSLTVHRKRIPRETVAEDNVPKGLEAAKEQDEKPGSHVQLDTELVFDVNSSKSAISVVQDIKGIETLHEDVIFVGYTADISGAKSVSKKDRFANKSVKKNYVFQQIKGAFLPVGLVGIIVFLTGALLLVINLGGFDFKIGSLRVDLPRSALLLAGGTLVTGYFIISVAKIRKRATALWYEK